MSLIFRYAILQKDGHNKMAGILRQRCCLLTLRVQHRQLQCSFSIIFAFEREKKTGKASIFPPLVFTAESVFVQFDIPATYPTTAPEIEIPELEGKTAKMYRGGKICLTIHFKPLWAKNNPHFGVAHALCLGLAPWLAAEVPFLVESGAVKAKS
jgi:hypothetical protein